MSLDRQDDSPENLLSSDAVEPALPMFQQDDPAGDLLSSDLVEPPAPVSQQDDSTDDLFSSEAGEPLVPILRVDEGKVDPVALATWHEALSNTLAVEVPHDLMGLWLYPAQGGTVLLGPAALAEDDLVVPVPAPYLKPEQLSLLEEIVTDAGYSSASCLPVRFGKRDVALLLLADLQAGRFGRMERVVLQCVAQRIAPMLGRIARQWTPVEGAASRQQERIAALLQAVANANREGSSPQRFLSAIGKGLAPLLPHEHIELLVPSEAGDQYFRLGEHPGGPIWNDPSLVIESDHLDIGSIFGSGNQLLVADTYEDDRWPRGFLTASEPAGADIRAIVGVRMSLKGRTPAYLLVGSIGPDLYEVEDSELLVLLGGLILPQVAEFLRAPAAPPAEGNSDEKDGCAELLLRLAGSLATTSDVASATRLIAHEGAKILPFDRLEFVLQLADGTRVALLRPGERRAILASVADTPLARILAGESSKAVLEGHGESQLVVPLRGGGRVHGAMVFSASTGELKRVHLNVAQQLADIGAAHVELLRGAVIRTPPTVPSRAHLSS
jgi:hypothetical protein